MQTIRMQPVAQPQVKLRSLPQVGAVAQLGLKGTKETPLTELSGPWSQL